MLNASERQERVKKLQELAIERKHTTDIVQIELLKIEMSNYIYQITESLTYSMHYKDLNETDLDELIQDSSITLLKKLCEEGYDPEASDHEHNALLSFFKRVIQGHYNNYTKTKANREKYLVDVEGYRDEDENESVRQIERFSIEEVCDEEIFMDDLKARLIRDLTALGKNDEERAFIHLAFVESFLNGNLSDTEIAKKLGCSSANITQRKKRIMKRFKDAHNFDDYKK